MGYLSKRGIDTGVARNYVQEIYYSRGDKSYFALPSQIRAAALNFLIPNKKDPSVIKIFPSSIREPKSGSIGTRI